METSGLTEIIPLAVAQLAGASILCILILSFPGAHCGEWLQPDGC